tara:strand:+ start:8347 stop:8661 length:315 start_codon:yes stop_codon:yes gene_type:complete
MSSEGRRIGEVRREILDKYNLDLSEERLRRYESLGLFTTKRDKRSNFRLFTEHDYNELLLIISLIELGVSQKDLLEKNTEAISRRVNTVAELIDVAERRYPVCK